MDNIEQIRINLPDNLAEEVEGFVQKNGVNKNEFIKNAVQNHLKRKRRKRIKKSLREGYPKVSELNRKLADEGIEYDSKIMYYYEELLESLQEHG